jgi:hypothetical protein
MSAVLTGNAAFHPKCGRKSGPTSGMSCDVNSVERKCNTLNLTRRPKGSMLSEVMVRKPESKSFPAKGGFEERDPSKRLGFFVDRNKTIGPGILRVLPQCFSYS